MKYKNFKNEKITDFEGISPHCLWVLKSMTEPGIWNKTEIQSNKFSSWKILISITIPALNASKQNHIATFSSGEGDKKNIDPSLAGGYF